MIIPLRRSLAMHVLLLGVNVPFTLPAQSTGKGPQLVWKTEPQFTAVGAVRLYADGSLILADAGAREVFHVSSTGKARKLGRTGAGPGEYQTPQSVQYLGSETLVVDGRLRRFLVYDSTGAFQRVIAFPSGSGGLTGRVSGDRSGRLWYYGDMASPLGAREVALRRLDVTTGQVDSVGTVTDLLLADIQLKSAPGSRQPSRSFMVVPYVARDGIVALPQGGVMVLRAATKQLQWIDANGKTVRTRVLPSPAEVDVLEESRKKVRPEALRDLVPKRQLAVDGDFMIAADNGDVWLPRVLPGVTTRAEWVVVPRQGNERRVALPTNARLLHVSGQTVTVAERTDDDLELIAVYRLPK